MTIASASAGSEVVIKQGVQLDIPPLTDETLTVIADALFVEHDKTEAADAEAKPR